MATRPERSPDATDAGTELRHEGVARRQPGDRDVPEIGDELRTCRAVTGLAHDLLAATVGDIKAIAGKPVDLAG